MISKDNAPAAWATLMYELEDAQEHLTTLVSKMSSEVDYDEVIFALTSAMCLRT